jgi:hypothetical protein
MAGVSLSCNSMMHRSQYRNHLMEGVRTGALQLYDSASISFLLPLQRPEANITEQSCKTKSK